MKLPLLALCVIVVSLVTGYPFPPPPGAPYSVDEDFGIDNLPRLPYDFDGQLEAFQPYPAAPEFNAPVDVEVTSPEGSDVDAQEGDQEEGRRLKSLFKKRNGKWKLSWSSIGRKLKRTKAVFDKVKTAFSGDDESVEE